MREENSHAGEHGVHQTPALIPSHGCSGEYQWVNIGGGMRSATKYLYMALFNASLRHLKTGRKETEPLGYRWNVNLVCHRVLDTPGAITESLLCVVYTVSEGCRNSSHWQHYRSDHLQYAPLPIHRRHR